MRTGSDAGSAGPAAPAREAGPGRPPGQPRLTSRPRLAAGVRLTFDRARQRHVLLTPETVTVLNDSGAAILGLCDGERTVAGILAELRGRYDGVADDEVRLFLAGMLAKRRVEVRGG